MITPQHVASRVATIQQRIAGPLQSARDLEARLQADFIAHPDSTRRLQRLMEARKIRVAIQRKMEHLRRISAEFLDVSADIDWALDFEQIKPEPIPIVSTITTHSLDILDQQPRRIQRLDEETRRRLILSARETGVRFEPHPGQEHTYIIIEPGVRRAMRPICNTRACTCIGARTIGYCRHVELLTTSVDATREVA